MKNIIRISIVIILILLLKVSISFTINEIVITNYEKENYNTSLAEKLYILNYNEPYIAYYNHGNLLYKQEQYKEAELKYAEALNKRPPESRVCDIQINLSLAKVKQIDMSDSEKALEKLKEARNILYENHCAAAKDDSGKSEEAEELENEIKELEKQLGGSEEEEENNGEEEEENPEEEQENEKEKEVEEKIKENRQDANEGRQESLQYFDPNGVDYSYNGDPW